MGIKIECEKCESKEVLIDVEVENERIVILCKKCGEATIVPLAVNRRWWQLKLDFNGHLGGVALNIDEIEVEWSYYDKKNYIKTKTDFVNYDVGKPFIDWLKEQDDVVSITVTKQTIYGKDVILSFW